MAQAPVAAAHMLCDHAPGMQAADARRRCFSPLFVRTFDTVPKFESP